MANDRLSQLVVEVLIKPTDEKARDTQLVVEVIIGPMGKASPTIR